MSSFLRVASQDKRGVGFDKYLDCLSIFLPDVSAEPEKAGRQFSWRANFAAVNGLTCWRVQGSHGYEITLNESAESLQVSQPVIGAVAAIGRYGACRALPGSLFTHLTDAPSRISTKGAHATRGLRFERPELMQALSTFDEKLSVQDLTPLMLHHLTETTTQSLYHSAQAVVSAVLDEDLQGRSPIAMALLSESLLLLVLERLTSGKLREPSESTMRHLRRAVDYMHSNIHRPFTMSDAAAAAGISVRTLQTAFQAHYGATPVTYLRRIRLEAAHLELTSSDNILPVSEVALKWGFTHMGRFAEIYRKTYGLLPSQLAGLRRRNG
ncbi:helix-turn-helix domain-containing protein [Bradyrhizobium neotropicale]|uniref:helix-turn-helix domain-containing protein n=1 Tax=Bradyrhizobium neotropicale TaxID=1497615 RepID=UPI001AD6B603|nr:helix-turn-helix transcriptional regulator [Bradyrhizobium neotropicale]